MTDFADLVPEVMEVCQKAPEPQVERCIRNAVIAFCSRTLLLRKTLDSISIVADQPLYTLIPPASRSIIDVLTAQIEDDVSLIEQSEQHFDLMWKDPQFRRDCCWDSSDEETGSRGDDWRQYTQSRPSAYYVDREENAYRLRLVGIPTANIDDSLVCVVTLKPTRDATECADWLMEEYFQCLINGAKARILEVPQQPWSNPQLAVYYGGLFEEATEIARMKGQRSHLRNDQTQRRVKAWV